MPRYPPKGASAEASERRYGPPGARLGNVAAMRIALALLASFLAPVAWGETLRVGPGAPFDRPSAAAAVARPGDTVLIAPGRYVDCAIWRAPGLTIVAADGGMAEITGAVCADKALFVVAAPSVTIVGIFFTGAVSTAGNGAGIRSESPGLTVLRSRFETNENGILAINDPFASLTIEDSAFLRNGAHRDGHDCAHGVYAGRMRQLVIRRSRFEGTRVCHHVKSRAQRTEITDTEILDTPEGEASFLLDLPNGGDLVFVRNRLRKGPRTGNRTAAVAIGFEGVSNPTTSIVIAENRFESLMARPTAFVANRGRHPASLSDNRLVGAVRPLDGPGEVR